MRSVVELEERGVRGGIGVVLVVVLKRRMAQGGGGGRIIELLS